MENLQPEKYVSIRGRYVLFVDLRIAQSVSAQELLLDFATNFQTTLSGRSSFIFHNGDKTPTDSFYLALRQLGISLFSVNVLDSEFGPTPIPLGLENRYHRNFGRLKNFVDFQSRVLSTETEIGARPHSFLAAFNVQTNPTERNETLAECSRRGIEVTSQLSPNQYQMAVRSTLFVLSPPGNGLDCHRTWESIYLGAVPVVKKSALSYSLYSNLPIVAVDTWDEVCSLRRPELEQLYTSIRARPLDLAKLETWVPRISLDLSVRHS